MSAIRPIKFQMCKVYIFIDNKIEKNYEKICTTENYQIAGKHIV
jgi:hypothetical protein